LAHSNNIALVANGMRWATGKRCAVRPAPTW
jgi:hypothetical protein